MLKWLSIFTKKRFCVDRKVILLLIKNVEFTERNNIVFQLNQETPLVISEVRGLFSLTYFDKINLFFSSYYLVSMN